MTPTTTSLSPAQSAALDQLLQYADLNPLLLLQGDAGTGKSTLLRRAHESLGGRILTAKDFVDAMLGRHPLAIEETLYAVVIDALRANDTVFLDDLGGIYMVTGGGCNAYPRAHY